MISVLWSLVPDHERLARRRLVVLAAASVAARAAACVLLVPTVSRLLSDEPGDALGWIGVFTLAVVINSVTQHRLAREGFALGLAVMEDVQHRMVDHLAALPVGWFSASNRGLAKRAVASTGPQVAQTIGNLVSPLVTAVALPVAIGIGLLFVAWPVGLAALAAAPLLVVAWRGGERLSRRADAEFAAAVVDLDERVIEFGRTQRILRGARRADPDRSPAGEALAEAHLATRRLLRFAIPGQLLFSVASQLALVLLSVVTLTLLHRGQVSVPECIALIVVLVRYLEPFGSLAEIAPAIAATTTSLREIDEVLSASPLEAGTITLTETDGPPPVEVTSVTFRHRADDDRPTVDDVSFTAPAGRTTAIVGPSGAGKSTLLGLIARFHDPDDGEIRIGGLDVRSLDATDHLSMVFQDVYLFEGTIRDNVLVGDPTADDTRLADVAELARVDEIVDRLPAGWDTPVGEGGAALSGGERQRISIARALLKPASLLLVDEATSALDTENEEAVVAALAAGADRRTTIVVAHRMRTIDRADHVVFVEGGRVVESGPPDRLLAAGGRFASFHRERRAGLGWTVSSGRGGSSEP